MPQEVHVRGPWWHLFCVISELKQPHCSPRSVTVMDTAESQANGHTSTALCCPPLQSRAPLQPTKLGQDASFQPTAAGPAHGKQWPRMSACSGQELWGWGCRALECRAAQAHPFPSEHTALPCSPASPGSPPKLTASPGNVLAAPALPRTARASPSTASQGPCPRLWEAPPSDQTLC